MAANPRVSGFWSVQSDRSSMGYFARDEEEDVGLVDGEDGTEDGGEGVYVSDGRTPLDRTIDRIGMGACFFVYCVEGRRRTGIGIGRVMAY